MHEATRRAAAVAASIPTAGTSSATMIRFDGAMCIVRDHLGVEQSYRWAGTIVPAPGDSVQVQVIDGVHLVTGRTMPTPSQGTVEAVSGTSLLVSVAVGPSPIEAAFTYASPAVGDVVALTHGFEGFLATGKSSFTPLPVEVEVDTPDTTTSGRQTFRATVAGNWQHGEWGSGRPIVSETRTAGFGYGPSLAATIPDDAEITAARIYLPTEQVMYPLAPGIQALAGEPPAIAGTGPMVALAARSGWVRFDPAVAQQLIAARRGIKLVRREHPTDGTWDIYKALSADPMSGALDLTWKA